jgi:hypothetical protein
MVCARESSQVPADLVHSQPTIPLHRKTSDERSPEMGFGSEIAIFMSDFYVCEHK